MATFDAFAHSLGSRTAPIFVQSSQAIDRNCRMLKLDYPSMRICNLPDSLISSAEDAEDCVAKFTSLVRARD